MFFYSFILTNRFESFVYIAVILKDQIQVQHLLKVGSQQNQFLQFIIVSDSGQSEQSHSLIIYRNTLNFLAQQLR